MNTFEWLTVLLSVASVILQAIDVLKSKQSELLKARKEKKNE